MSTSRDSENTTPNRNRATSEKRYNNAKPSPIPTSTKSPLQHNASLVKPLYNYCTKCELIIPQLPTSLIDIFVPRKITANHKGLSCPPHIHHLSNNLAHYLSTLLSSYGRFKVILYYRINLTNFLHGNNAQVTTPKHHTADPSLTELFNFCSGTIMAQTQTYWPGRLPQFKKYYPPSSPLTTTNTFLTQFNRETPFSEYASYHPMELTDQIAPKEPSSNLHPDWENFRTLKFYNSFTTVALIDSDSNPWVTFQFLQNLFSRFEIESDILTPSFLLSKSTKVLEGPAATLMDFHLKEVQPNSSRPTTHTMIPAITAARTIEILLSLAAHKIGITHYTPITGTIEILNEVTPFILLNGVPYIAWDWAIQIIPRHHNHAKYVKGKNVLHLQRPIQIHGWAQVHWNLATLISGLPYYSNIITSLPDALVALNTTASWVNHDHNRQLDLAMELAQNELFPGRRQGGPNTPS